MTRTNERPPSYAYRPERVYVQSLRLSKIGISATTKLKEVVGMLDGDGAAGFNPGSALMQAGLKIFATVGVTLAEVDHAPITIDALELPRKGKDHFTTQQALVAELTAHLVHQALLCSFKILGSNPNFGNPVALLDSTFDGIKDFGQGLAGIADGDLLGVGTGALSLGKNVASGVF